MNVAVRQQLGVKIYINAYYANKFIAISFVARWFNIKIHLKMRIETQKKYTQQKKTTTASAASTPFLMHDHNDIEKLKLKLRFCVCVFGFVSNKNFIIFWLCLKDFSVYLFKFLIFDFNSWELFTEQNILSK